MSEWTWPALRAAATIADDAAVLAINKPVGISVMGERHDDDIVELAAAAGERLYPVHRIDKVTSGVVLLARTLDAHAELTRQFTKRTVDKRYLALTGSVGLPDHGVIDLPLGTGRKGTIRIAAPRERIRYDEAGARWWVAEPDLVPDKKSYPSVTRFVVVWRGPAHTLLVAQPVTGRRHQLRVHFGWIGHPLLGDPLFDKAAPAQGRRTALHSWRLALDASWRAEHRWTVEAPAGPDFWQPVADQLPAEARAEPLGRAGDDPFLAVGGLGQAADRAQAGPPRRAGPPTPTRPGRRARGARR